LVAHARGHGMFVTLITNGYMLTPELIGRLNRAGLDHLQISIDNVEPDTVSRRARQLGFQGSVGVIHDGQGQLQSLSPTEKDLYREIKRLHGWRPVRLNRTFQDNL